MRFEPMPREPSPAAETAYRTTAALLCASCGTAAGDDHTFTKGGDVQCRRCADQKAHAAAAIAASRSAGVDLAGERRCDCGGVASAGKMVDHVAKQTYRLYGMPVGEAQIEMGSETVFSCAACGKGFALLNRLRWMRLAVRAGQLFLLGLALGAIALVAIDGYLGWLGLLTVTAIIGGLGARPLIRDARLRRAHWPIG